MILDRLIYKVKRTSALAGTGSQYSLCAFAPGPTLFAASALGNIAVYPYSSYQRGTNENTNGLLRRFFPKGTDLNEISEIQIDKVAAMLNNRPRKCLTIGNPMRCYGADRNVAHQTKF